MITDKEVVLSAARADNIPAGRSGCWYIKKAEVKETHCGNRNGRMVEVGPGIYTHLFRLTWATLHKEPPGEVVMEDTPHELKTHLQFMLQAHGDVLVTGLGLGCVTRGLLENPNVNRVTCLEKSPDVIALVGPYMPADRLEIIQADALEWTAENTRQFDCAYHDLWTDRENGEPHLDRWHLQVIFNCRKFTQFQGAWSFWRPMRRLIRQYGINLL